MPIPAAGQVALSQIELELSGLSGYEENINDTSVRLFASLGNNDGVLPANSEIRWSMFYGKGVLKLSNSATTTNYNLRTNSDSNGYGTTYTAGKTLVQFTNTGTIGSTLTGSAASAAAFRTGSFTSGDRVQVTNNGNILGAGGNGGGGGTAIGAGNTLYYGLSCIGANTFTGGGLGGAGGNAMYIEIDRTFVNNNGTIGGGGGGGSGSSGAIGGFNGPNDGFYGLGGAGGGGGAGYGGGGGGGGQLGFKYTTGGTGPGTNFCSGPFGTNVLGVNPIGGNGSPGSLLTGGLGGSASSSGLGGFKGGDLGQPGVGGAANGTAIVGYSLCIYSGSGTLAGGTSG